MSSLSASCLQPSGIAASDFAHVQAARAKNRVARSRAAQPSSSPKPGPASATDRALVAYANAGALHTDRAPTPALVRSQRGGMLPVDSRAPVVEL
jgi:hypothetical protein